MLRPTALPCFADQGSPGDQKGPLSFSREPYIRFWGVMRGSKIGSDQKCCMPWWVSEHPFLSFPLPSPIPSLSHLHVVSQHVAPKTSTQANSPSRVYYRKGSAVRLVKHQALRSTTGLIFYSLELTQANKALLKLCNRRAPGRTNNKTVPDIISWSPKRGTQKGGSAHENTLKHHCSSRSDLTRIIKPIFTPYNALWI